MARLAKLLLKTFARFWHRNWWHKVIVVGCALGLAGLLFMLAIAGWYYMSVSGKPYVIGTSFIPDYASYLGVDPRAAYSAMLDDLGVKHLRLVSYWSDIEKTEGTYDFSELDWEFQQAQAHGADISLAIGLRQPRWPECHAPDWAADKSIGQIQPQLNTFITAVVQRYRTNPALASYQLENEYYLMDFGTCTDDSQQRLIDETALVRSLDPHHTLIITRSDNWVGWPIHAPVPDLYGISVYRKLWSTPINHYVDYPFTAWYYAFMAGAEKLWSGKDSFIHELQAEPWPPMSQDIRSTTLAEQDKTFDANILKQNVDFAKRTGMRSIYLWGTEYWYYRMEALHDPSVWNAARDVFQSEH